MFWLPETIQERLVIVLAHFVWQGVAIAGLLAALIAVLNVKRPSVRYASSLFAFLLMAACPVVTWFLVPNFGVPNFGVRGVSPALDSSSQRLPTPTDIVGPRLEAFEASTPETLAVDFRTITVPTPQPEIETQPAPASDWRPALRRFEPWIIVAWLCGVAMLSLRLLFGAVGIWRWRRAVELVPESLLPMIERLWLALSGPRSRFEFVFAPRVRVCRRVAEAVAMGLFKPMVLLPAAWVTELPADMLEAVLAHELAHVRRLDLWVNLLQRLVETLLFYHPAVWWLSRRLRIERELCCDDLAATVTRDRVRYAETLEHVARLNRLGRESPDPVLAVAMIGREGVLLRRIRQLLGVTPQARTGSPWLAGLLTLGLVLVIALGTFVSSRAAVEPPRAGRGSPDPALDSTAGLPNSDDETNPANNANGDLRSNPAAGSGDPRRAPLESPIAAVDPVKELASFQGTWSWDFSQPWTWPQPIGVGVDGNGRKSEKRWVIRGNQITWISQEGRRINVNFTIDPTKTPKQIEFTFLNGPLRGQKSIGIYESRSDADHLHLCMTDPGTDAPRPTDYSAGTFKQQSIIVIHRVAPPEKPSKAKALERLQGVWQMTLCDSMTKDFGGTQQEASKWQWTIKGDEILWSREDRLWKMKFAVDPAKSPNEIDLTYLVGPFKGKKCLGMYVFGGVDGQSLMLSIQDPGSQAPRPTSISQEGGVMTSLIFLRPSDPSDTEREIGSFQGTWTLKNFDTGNFDRNKDPSSWPLPGGKGPDKSGEGSELRWTIKGNEITWTNPSGAEIKASFTIDSSKSPKQIDLTFLNGANKGETCPGIYQRGDLDPGLYQRGDLLDENNLWLCMADPKSKTARPKKFSYQYGEGRSLMSFYPFEPAEPRAGRGSPDTARDTTAGLPNSEKEANKTNNANGDLRSNPAAGSGDLRGAQELAKGLEFLKPYPRLHGLSLNMTEPQFLEIVKQQELKTRKTVDDGKVTHHIGLGDGHTLIVMFDKDAKCSGIQRVRGEDDAPQQFIAKIEGGPTVELLGMGTHQIVPESWWAANGRRWGERPHDPKIKQVQFSTADFGKDQAECRELLMRVTNLPKGETHLAYQWQVDGFMDWAHRGVLTESTEFSAGFSPRVSRQTPAPKSLTLRVGIGELPDDFVRTLNAAGEKVGEPPTTEELRQIDALLQPVRVAETNGQVELLLKPTDRAAAPIVVDYVPVAVDKSGQKHERERTTPGQRPGLIAYVYPISKQQLDHFECRFHRYRHQVVFENVSLVAGHETDVKVTIDQPLNPAAAVGDPRRAQAKNKDAQALFKLWSARARANGSIPGALIGQLAESVTTFTKYNPTWETTPQLLKMLPRLDATHDWTEQDAVTLVEELAALQASPIGMLLDNEFERTIQAGKPLPKELADAPWGEALPSGLRMAWLLEPRAAEHRLGTALKSRVLIHNAGKNAVVFRTRTWHQVGHKARDANGEEISIESTHWTTRGRLVPFRLAPGEFIEVNAPGIGVGANRRGEDWQYTKVRVGSWIDAKAGDKVVISTNPLPLTDWNEEPRADGDTRWWRSFIEARLSQDLPLPDDAKERTRLLDHAVRELFGTAPTADETAAFVADREPSEVKEVLARRETVIGALAKRLANRAGTTAFSGSLQSRSTIFSVLPPDPDAAKKPRSASNPGQHSLGGNATLVVTRRPIGERIVNEAHLAFSPADATKPAPREPHEIKLPDGYDTWAAAWMREATVLWVQQKGSIRRYDFTNPGQVMEKTFAESEFDQVPKPIREALRAEVDLSGASK